MTSVPWLTPKRVCCQTRPSLFEWCQSDKLCGASDQFFPIVVMQHTRPLPLSTVTRQPPVLSPPGQQTRISLPPRHVDAHTIENTYVQFVLACNPAVALDANTSVLREAFQAPPKSGGKSFSTWKLFQLIAQFQSRQIKTWGDLALKLGVEPPDQEMGESSQKIQQYAVRLKVGSWILLSPFLHPTCYYEQKSMDSRKI